MHQVLEGSFRSSYSSALEYGMAIIQGNLDHLEHAKFPVRSLRVPSQFLIASALLAKPDIIVLHNIMTIHGPPSLML